MKSRVWSSLLVSSLLTLCLGFTIAGAQAQEKALTKSDVEAIVKKVIHDNPELLVNSLKEYQAAQQAAAISKAAQNVVGMQGICAIIQTHLQWAILKATWRWLSFLTITAITANSFTRPSPSSSTTTKT